MTLQATNLSRVDVSRVTMAEVFALWRKYGTVWRWHNPFVTPPWLAAWWRCFGDGRELLLLRVSTNDIVLGVAPLMLQNGSARIIGSTDLCDYGDCIVAPDGQDRFYGGILSFLAAERVKQLILPQIRPDSSAYRRLLPAAEESGWQVSVNRQNSSLQLTLPSSWEHYLKMLGGKQRHEARRKLRRVHEAGHVEMVKAKADSGVVAAIDVFLHLFRHSRHDKMAFMTETREKFFRALAQELAQCDMLSLISMKLDGRPAAALFCVESGDTLYLYNNGFDPRFRAISLGVASKLLSIKMSIEAGMRNYDFLSGTEAYKYRLGATEVPLYECVIERK